MVKKQIKRLIIDVVGLIFIILGVLGLFLPFFQGIIFLIIGLYLLSLHSPSIAHFIDSLKTRYPKIGGAINKFDDKVRKLLGIDQNS